MSGIDKNRFIPEESGRLVTAFLERFFERYVSYDYTAELEEGLDDVSGGRTGWQNLLERLLARLQAQGGRGDGAEAVGSDRRARRFPCALAVPRTRGWRRSAGLPACGTGRLGLRGGKFGAFVACSNYPECKYTQKFGQGGADAVASDGPVDLGEGITLRSGRFGAYVQQGEDKDAKRASIPKDVGTDGLTLEMAQKLLSLPRRSGRIRRPASRSARRSGATGPTSSMTANMPGWFDRRGVRDGHERRGGEAYDLIVVPFWI